MTKLLSVVVSVYNEELALREFYAETGKILKTLPADWDYEFLFVNDGSRDQSLSILREFAESDEKVKIVNFSRNFGHEAAMIAGLDYAGGDGIVCMDADLQHPPECLPEIVEKFDEGYEVISMVRTKNKTAGFVKNFTSAAFYKLINHLSDVKFEANASDFFAVSKNAAEVLRNNYREKVRFLRGYVQSIGFEKTTIEYEARPRFAGESKYSIKVLPVQADVCAGGDNEATVQNVVKQAVDAFGGIQVLINNAQASASGVSLAEHTTEQFDLALYSGLYAAFYYMKACYPYLKESHGSVINFASGAGLFGNYGQCAYAAAKEGIRGLSRVAATEWGPDDINVNVVCPLAWTAKLEQFQQAYPEAFKANVKMPPMGHYGNAEQEIGRVCVQLAMPDFKFMSGETLTLEGGMGQRP